jgi:hypothetical protein
MCLSGLFKFKYITPVPVEFVGLIFLSLAASPYFFKVIGEPEDHHIDDVRLKGWLFAMVVFAYVAVVIVIRL